MPGPNFYSGPQTVYRPDRFAFGYVPRKIRNVQWLGKSTQKKSSLKNIQLSTKVPNAYVFQNKRASSVEILSLIRTDSVHRESKDNE